MPNRKRKYSDVSSEATMESDIYGEGASSIIKDILPMKHSTIKKLIKENKIKDADIIGGMLKSEIAKELYKNNIRVHHKHYIPKDKKKYFYDEEIKGGKLNIGNAFKKIGSTVKHTFNKAVEGAKDIGHKIEDFGEKAVEKTGDYINTVLHGRNDYPPKVREIIKEFGEKTISSIVADRTPVVGALTTALNVVSMGAFKKRLERTPYDKLYHLRIDITFTDGSRIALEKNEVINAYKNPKKLKGGEQHQISNIPQGLTLNKLLEGGEKVLGGKYFKYSAYDNNCQDFIIALLKGSNVGTQSDYDFIKQQTESLFNGDSTLRKVANTVTDLGAKVNEITTGTGLEDGNVQSVVFDKDYWTIKKAQKWLIKHGYESLGCDEKENTLRFRQIDPQDNFSYITKSLPNNVELIIAYKNKNSNNKYNKMGKSKKHIKKYESDSSDSDSDSSMKGRGIRREKAIIKKIDSLADEIHEHQKVHGGKIDIAGAFKNLGNTIKHGFEDKIINPIKSGVEDKIIHPAEAGFKKDIIDPFKKDVIGGFQDKIINPSEKAIVPLVNKAGKYITSKKGGLASDLLHTGLPMVTGTLAGAAAEALFPEAGPVAGFVGNQAGKYGGKKLADYIGSKTGVGLKKRGRPPKNISSKGDLVHIDIGSHDDSPMKGDGIKKKGLRRTKNTSLEQMIEAHRTKEKGELMDAIKTMASDINKEKHPPKTPKYSKALGSGFKKGSPEAKEHMAKLRAMRKGKK